VAGLLSVDGISVNFGGVQALQNVSFSLGQGELLGLIGPNGAGKTTAMRAITGVVSPDAGSVLIKGTNVTRAKISDRVRLGLGMSQQLVKPFHAMSVIENVILAAGYTKTRSPLAALMHCDRSHETTRSRELLDLVGIGETANASPAELPLGYLKRLEVARALALDPSLLLLDEPLAGLNHLEAAKLADTIKDLNNRGLSIILIEHNLGEVMRICSRLVVLDNGRNLSEGDPQSVMSNVAVRAAYLGEEAVNA